MRRPWKSPWTLSFAALLLCRSLRPAIDAYARLEPRRYVVFPRHFCACQAFFFDVVHRGEAIHVRSLSFRRSLGGPLAVNLTSTASSPLLLQCKHQLAARIAAALGRAPPMTVPDVSIAALLARQF